MKTRAQMQAELVAGFKSNYGNGFELGVNFEVTPSQVQSFEEKKRQEFAFLNEITMFPTDQNNAAIVSFMDGGIADQRHSGRNPIGNNVLGDRKYLTREIQQDVQATWAEQTQWGSNKQNYYNLWRAYVLRKRARGTLRVGFWGQKWTTGVNSDLTASPMGEDIQAGWLQYMILNHPQNVFGIVADPLGTILDKNGVKYKVSPINVGVGGDFVNIAQLVQYVKDTMIDLIYRSDAGIKAIVGDSLRAGDRQRLMAQTNEPMQLSAVESLLAMNQIANMQAVTPDEFPTSGIMVTNPKNLQYVYQTNGVYREVREWADAKATQDLLLMYRDYVIQAPEGLAMVHPDAIHIKNGAGAWVNPNGWSEWSLT